MSQTKNKLQRNLEILTRATQQWMRPDRPMVQTTTAPELQQLIDVSLAEHGCSSEELEAAINDYLKYSPNCARPEFFKLLYSGLNEDALLGDWITSLSNTTMHTYQVGPVSTLMELELIRQWNKLVGFANGEGVMVPGGSQANLIGMMLARHRVYPDLKSHGLIGGEHRPLVAYVSDQAHYSYLRAANLLGIGTDNLIKVASNEAGQICPQALNTAIESDIDKGRRPFFIGLTAGTTVIGAYDCVTDCSVIANKHNAWLHIDGAWGAPVLFSEKYRSLLADSHLADSFAWDAHKLMNVPITAAVILVKQAGALQACTSGGGGEYLFHNDENSDYNLGERSIQCGRRADALKVWLSWKALGNKGFADKVDYLQGLKSRCLEMLEVSDCLQMLAPAAYLNVLFRYVPHSLPAEDQIAKLNIEICKTMKRQGGAYVDYAQYKGRTGIRLILANELCTEEDLQRLLRESERIGRSLEKN